MLVFLGHINVEINILWLGMPVNCHFQANWVLLPEFEEWLKPGNTTQADLCLVCNKEFSIAGQGVSQVKQHAAGKTHINNKKAASDHRKSNSILALFKSSDSTQSPSSLHPDLDRPSSSSNVVGSQISVSNNDQSGVTVSQSTPLIQSQIFEIEFLVQKY